MTRLSFVICTYERPALLADLLASIFALRDLDRAAVDVVVVDNSDGETARTVVERAGAGAPVPVTYRAAHPANISVARNAALAASDAAVVALIDDDQTLDPGWLTAVLDALERDPYDVFFGAIVPRFEDEASAGPDARALFTRASAAPAGTEVWAQGHRQDFAVSTANCVLRRVPLLDEPAPFDPRLGISGGEDLHLFCRLQRRGHRFGWLPDAKATDFVPKHRCAPAYLIARHYAGGQVYAAATIWTDPVPPLRAAVVAGKALTQLLLLPVAGLKTIGSPRGRFALTLRLAGIWGKLFWRGLHPLYSKEARPG